MNIKYDPWTKQATQIAYVERKNLELTNTFTAVPVPKGAVLGYSNLRRITCNEIIPGPYPCIHGWGNRLLKTPPLS